ncbi:hypothetical protein LWC34_00105 [Kibdelosporangium philippinense]|uniref:Uncharacterized protein n=1 Tax=Kibdelosporangium philippinense TaxID=211113 RepID=A0ABS8Z070_9PSEU|nr:hypothetical protein [Kibdelosporangium philippinense]MCE7001250.1 hypothetical protein [Kibdelosporangium philippinense]
MTNWGQLSHAYGTAEDIPGQLDVLRTDPTPERWNDLWSALCHQGSVYSASFAALPRLAQIAEQGDAEQRTQALVLAGAIVGSDDRPSDLGDVRAIHAADIAALLVLTRQHLPSVTDRTEYIYLVQSLLAFEDHPVGNDPLDGLVDEVYELDCPHCAELIVVALGNDVEPDVQSPELVPADPSDLSSVPRQIHDDALKHGHPQVAIALTYLFGQAVCTDCGESFGIADQAEVAFR